MGSRKATRMGEDRMAAYKRFTGGGDGEIFKFDVPGKSIEGEFVKVVDGKFGPLVVLHVGDSEVTCATSTGLLQCFDEAFGGVKSCPPGTKLLIEFKEMVQTKKGGTFKRFELGVDSEAVDGDDIPY